MQLNLFLAYTICKLKIFQKGDLVMKKGSLFALAAASVLALVGCGGNNGGGGKKVPVGKDAMEKTVSWLFTSNPKKPYEAKMGEGTFDRDDSGLFWDVESEHNNSADYFLYDEEVSDIWACCFYLYKFTKVGEMYQIVESGQTYSFTLDQLNNLGNNIAYDMFYVDDPEDYDPTEKVPVTPELWRCAELYYPVEGDEDDKISSYFQFVNCGDSYDINDATLVAEGFVFVRDEVDTKTGTTYSYLFIELIIGDAAEYN